MRLLKIVPLGLFLTVTLAQQPFEPSNFDITAALLENGVDVSDIPGLASLSKRTRPGGCVIAVSLMRLPMRCCPTDPILTFAPVQCS
jgi:hypothetical protein